MEGASVFHVRYVFSIRTDIVVAMFSWSWWHCIENSGGGQDSPRSSRQCVIVIFEILLRCCVVLVWSSPPACCRGLVLCASCSHTWAITGRVAGFQWWCYQTVTQIVERPSPLSPDLIILGRRYLVAITWSFPLQVFVGDTIVVFLINVLFFGDAMTNSVKNNFLG